MVDTQAILENYMMKMFTCGEVIITKQMIEEFKGEDLICHYKHEEGTITVRTQEYNDKCADKF